MRCEKVKFKIIDDEVAPGVYEAEYLGAKLVENDYGEGAVFGFRIIGGKYDGAKAMRTCDKKATLTNVTGKMLMDLAGVGPSEDLEIDEREFRGEQYEIEVAKSPKGNGTRVERIVREPKQNEDWS